MSEYYYVFFTTKDKGEFIYNRLREKEANEYYNHLLENKEEEEYENIHIMKESLIRSIFINIIAYKMF